MWWSRSSGAGSWLPGCGASAALSLATTLILPGADSNEVVSIPLPLRTSVRNRAASPVLPGGFEVSSLI